MKPNQFSAADECFLKLWVPKLQKRLYDETELRILEKSSSLRNASTKRAPDVDGKTDDLLDLTTKCEGEESH